MRRSGPTSNQKLDRSGERCWAEPDQAPGDGVARLKSVRVLPSGGGSPEEIDIREAIDVEVEFWMGDPGSLRPTVNLSLPTTTRASACS